MGPLTIQLTVLVKELWTLYAERARPVGAASARFFTTAHGRDVRDYSERVRAFFCDVFGDPALVLTATGLRRAEATAVVESGASPREQQVLAQYRAHSNATAQHSYLKLRAAHTARQAADIRARRLGTIPLGGAPAPAGGAESDEDAAPQPWVAHGRCSPAPPPGRRRRPPAADSDSDGSPAAPTPARVSAAAAAGARIMAPARCREPPAGDDDDDDDESSSGSMDL